jgi:methyl-accepting chemotaxis protein
MKRMKSIRNLKIGTKLLAAFIILGAITAFIGYMGNASLSKIAGLSRTSYDRQTVGIQYLKQINIDIAEVDRSAKNVMLASSQEEAEQYEARVEKYEQLVDQDLDKSRPLLKKPKSVELLKKIDTGWKKSRELTNEAVALSLKEPRPKERPSVELSMGDGLATSDVVEDLLSQLAQNKANDAKTAQDETDKTYNSSRTLLIALCLVGILLGVGFGSYISRGISKPLGVIAEAAQRIAQGDVNQKVDYRSGDEVGSVAEAFRAVIDAVNALTRDAATLSQAAAEGKLDTRADASRHQGDYRKIIEGVNDTLDAIVLPVNESVRILGQIAGGNLREKVELDCKGDYQKMKDAVNGLHLWLTQLVAFITMIANGDLTATMGKSSEQDQIYQWLHLMKKNIKALAADAELLATAAVEGKLAVRADAAKHRGEYRQIIEGVNDPGCGDCAAQQSRQLCGSHWQRRYSRQDHGNL